MKLFILCGDWLGINYNIPRGNGAGRKTILDTQDREILVDILNAQPRISRKALGKELEKRTGKSIHNSTLNRELCRLRHHGHNFAACSTVVVSTTAGAGAAAAASLLPSINGGGANAVHAAASSALSQQVGLLSSSSNGAGGGGGGVLGETQTLPRPLVLVQNNNYLKHFNNNREFFFTFWN